MASHKLLITTLLIFAVAAQPAAAALAPCCCFEKVGATSVKQIAPKAEAPCCATKLAKAESIAAPVPSCCAHREQEQRKGDAESRRLSVGQAGCCCVKPAPTVPGERVSAVQRTIESVASQLSIDAPSPLVPAPAVRGFEQTPGAHSLTGPPLLALLCVWRK